MDIINIVTEHLNKKDRYIAVTQGNTKLTKPNTNVLKFNWTKEDITTHFGTLENFFKALPEKGFGSGSVLSLRKKHGSTTQLEGEVKLKFKNQEDNSTESHNTTTQTQQSMENQASQPQLAMGYTAIPQTELISLKVLQERYTDIVDKLKLAEKERDQAQSDLRMEKERSFGLERKLETIEDRHLLAIEKVEANNKKFFDTDAGKEVITGLAASMPQIIEAIKPRQSGGAVGMGNPVTTLPPIKQQFYQAVLVPATEDVLETLNMAYQAFQNEPIHQEIRMMLENINPNPENNG